MNAEEVKEMLPVIIAFSERKPIQYKESSTGLYAGDWATINPNTNHFNLLLTKPSEWRVKPIDKETPE